MDFAELSLETDTLKLEVLVVVRLFHTVMKIRWQEHNALRMIWHVRDWAGYLVCHGYHQEQQPQQKQTKSKSHQ